MTALLQWGGGGTGIRVDSTRTPPVCVRVCVCSFCHMDGVASITWIQISPPPVCLRAAAG